MYRVSTDIVNLNIPYRKIVNMKSEEASFTQCRYENCLTKVWNRNGMLVSTKRKRDPSCCHLNTSVVPVWFHDGTTPRLISQWNKAGTIWCHHLSTKLFCY